MERMEVDQCAGAAGGAGGGALRRSNSAPMITSVSDAMTVFSPVSSARYRRSSVSINPSCPSQLVPPSPFFLAGDRVEPKRQEENMEAALRGNLHRFNLPPVRQWDEHSPAWFQSHDGGITPNSSPSPARRFRAGAGSRCPVVAPLKRKGGAESDGPPKKLFVAGITDSAHHSYTPSVSPTDSPPAGGISPESSPLSLSPPPHSFTHFSHQRPGH